MLDKIDLNETVSFENYQNFSMGIQLKPRSWDLLPDPENYRTDCLLINKLSGFTVYNFKTSGFDGLYTNTLYGGDIHF